MENFDCNSPKSKKRKYYLNNRENFLNKGRQKYYELNLNEKLKISKRNKRKYKSLSVGRKEVLAQGNREKYRNMTVEQRCHLKFKNQNKYIMLTAVQKLKLNYKKLMTRMKNQQCIAQINLRSNAEFGKLVSNYVECIKEGPTEICECCGGLFFKKSTKTFSSNYFYDNFDVESIPNFLCVPSLVSIFNYHCVQ